MKHDERGSMVIWAVGFTFVVLVLGLLATEAALGFNARRQAAAIADSAAAQASEQVTAESAATGNPQLDVAAATAAAEAAAHNHPQWDGTMTAAVSATPETVTVRIVATRPSGPLAQLVGAGDYTVAATGLAQPRTRR